jgi:hypothetical protein
MVFFGCLGGMWIMVALLVAVVVALADMIAQNPGRAENRPEAR